MTEAHVPAAEPLRVRRERQTVVSMIRIYCRDRHPTRGVLGDDCAQLQAYALVRLDHCLFGADKPTCAHCPVHCYKPERREQIRAVMRYAGPRMLWRHPLLALRHLLAGRRKPPPVSPRTKPGLRTTAH
jgi:hypothetical protein